MIYYSQNDLRWKYIKMGYSNLTLGNYGCLTSALCTLASWFGENLTPKVCAKTLFLYTKPVNGKGGGLIIWKQLENLFQKIKFLYRYYSFNESIIDEYLIKNPNTAVVLQVDRGYHWVAALNKNKTGYFCSNPWNYPARKRTYKKEEITGFAVLIKK
jgi:hypothetical protein